MEPGPGVNSQGAVTGHLHHHCTAMDQGGTQHLQNELMRHGPCPSKTESVDWRPGTQQ